jgi:D-alanine--poly(phosphoribitol) ligase subunit 1
MLKELLGSLTSRVQSNAFCINDKFFSYRDVYERVLIFNAQFEKFLNQKDDLKIAIYCENNIETYSSILTCWLSGCTFIPILEKNPQNRNLEILKEAQVDLIIGNKKVLDNLENIYHKIDWDVNLDIKASQINLVDFDTSKPAYILFTSGSTGKPKGVPISFNNLNAFIKAFNETGFSINKNDRCLQMFELTFDVSISSFLTALISGACVYTVNNDGIKYIEVLRVINKYKLTSIQIVPSVIRLGQSLLNRIDFNHVNQCILTGEATDIEIYEKLRQQLTRADIYNFYGPTEATIYCSYYRCTEIEVKSFNGLLAIGKGFNGTDLIIVNDNGNKAEPFEKGELLIRSKQLTSGYIDSTLNTGRFSEFNGDIYYRSGDNCFIDKEGDIYYCGRLDSQVQIQGFRVEINEVEFKSKKVLSRDLVVLAVKNDVGFLELNIILDCNPKEVNEDFFKKLLREELPEYMIPSRIKFVDEFPLTSSGKIDRNQLSRLIK